jgi:DUF1680 family protein
MRTTLLYAPMIVFFVSFFFVHSFGSAEGAAPDRDGGIIKTDGSPHARLSSVDLADVRWTEGFWPQQFQKARNVTLPRLWELADEWAWNNMLVAAGEKAGEAKGCYWEDAWIYKWLEAACYVYTQTRDAALLAKMDEITAVIAKAQQPDGYIATQVTLRDFERFAFHHHHELYTMGHLITAACAHHRITGKTDLLDVARRAADYVHATFKDGDPRLANCPVNPSIIMASVELYRTTGERKYLDLANIIINNRGRKRGEIGRTAWGRPLGGTDLNQDRRPLRQETEVVGHAVFFTYLYAGATDAYMETGDSTLLRALERLWHDLTDKKMFITGGVCPVHKGLSSRSYQAGKRVILNDEVHEAAGLPYDLPGATAYNETCGQIGNMMWNWRMLFATGEARFADIMERNLYNSILSGVNITGKGWSYTNPLRWYGSEHELLSNDYHQRMDPGDRQICCPTNLLRTVASMHGYLYSASDEGLWVHHYGGSVLETELPSGRKLNLTQTTQYPWQGNVRLSIEELAAGDPFSIMLRIPGWAKGASILVNGEPSGVETTPQSYAALNRAWREGDVIELSLPMPVRMMVADARVEQTRNQVAIMRGPIVYCLESIDLPLGVAIENVHMPRQAEWTIRHDPDLLQGVTVLETEAYIVPGVKPDGGLYQELPTGEPHRFSIRLIPYFAWNNRGEPKMTVWLPLY